ncbi:MAG: thioredoxin [Patescibacteria group bacterium]|jgi:thioredoxin 1
MAEVIVTDQNFDAEVLKSDVPVLVDFWAPWCGPCRVLGPIVEKLAVEFAGKPIKIAKMNVDENQATAGGFGILSIPTLLFFKGGKVVEQLVGVQPEEVLRQKLNALAS